MRTKCWLVRAPFLMWLGLLMAAFFVAFIKEGEAQQKNIAVVDKLFVEEGGHLFEARSIESGRRYKVHVNNCYANKGELVILVVEADKGLGFYSNRGTWCLVRELWPEQ